MRSRKITFSKKVQRKNLKQTRKQLGGDINDPLEDKYRVYKDGEYGGIPILWTQKFIEIPKKGNYKGEYYLDDNKIPVMQGYGMLVSFDQNKSNGNYDIYDGYWQDNLKHGLFIFEYKNGDSGTAFFYDDIPLPAIMGSFFRNYEKKRREDYETLPLPSYNHHDGRVYEGELVTKKNGKVFPVNDTAPPRTVFNFAPGPTEFLDFNDKLIKIPKQIAYRGFRMSEPANMREIVPPTPNNSPNQEQKVARRGLGLKDRIYEIKRSRLNSPIEHKPMKKEELAFVKEITASQKVKPLQPLKKSSVLPPISSTKKGGNRRRNNKTKKTKSNL